nr:hypothetical protein [Bifidobacterium sp. UTBIF-78]
MNITSMGRRIRSWLQDIKQRFNEYGHKLHIGHPYLALAMVFGLVFDSAIWLLVGREYSFALLVYTIAGFVYIFVPKIGSIALIVSYLLLGWFNCAGSEYAFIITITSFASVAFLFPTIISLCIIAVAFLMIFVVTPDLQLAFVLISVYLATYCTGYAIKNHTRRIVDEEAYKKRIALFRQRETAGEIVSQDSDTEQAYLAFICKRLKLNFRKLSVEERKWLKKIAEKSDLLKNPKPQRGRR